MTQRALVIGLARTGVATARALAADGWEVTVVDSADTADVRSAAQQLPAGVESRLGGYSADVADGFDLVSPSPGVHWDAPELAHARTRGIPIRSEISLFLERCPARVLGITGTNGKTTTTALTAAIVAASGVTTHRGGNIGEPVLDRVSTMRASDWVVLELSSYQLESLSEFSVYAGAVLNVTPDHLDRHGSLAAYAALKESLATAAQEAAVLNVDDAICRVMAERVTAPVRAFGSDLHGRDGATRAGSSVAVVEGGRVETFMGLAEIPLYGQHNVDNVLAAVCLARAAGVDLDTMAGAIREFRPVDHRLQPVRDEDGVLWVNDSKATNVDAALKALDSFGERSIVWIGGGSSKGVGPDVLADAVAARARFAILCGATGPELDAALSTRGFHARRLVDGLEEAVALAREVAKPHDVVLFAPGYASFDQFNNYEERGRVFAALVSGTPRQIKEGQR